MIFNFDPNFELPNTDLCIVGAGPVGLAVALAAEAAGLSILVIESGYQDHLGDCASLSDAIFSDVSKHAPMNIAVRRGLGGTSAWWGGRLVSFDDVDFEPRKHVPNVNWPIKHEEVQKWLAQQRLTILVWDQQHSKMLVNTGQNSLVCKPIV